MHEGDRRDEQTPDIARVVAAPVRALRRPPVPGARRLVALAAVLIVGVIAVGASIRRPDAASVGAEATAPATFADVATPLPEPSSESVASDAVDAPSASPAPTAESAPTPQVAATERPPTPTATQDPNVDPGPTDAPWPTWTPAPVFVGSATMVDRCFDKDGNEQVMVSAEWDSPVPITGVEAWLDDGSSAGANYFPGGSYAAGISSSVAMTIGSTRIATIKFLAGPTYSDVVATRISAPFTAQQGTPCPP